MQIFINFIVLIVGMLLGSYILHTGSIDYVIKSCQEQQAVELRGKWYDCVRMLEEER